MGDRRPRLHEEADRSSRLPVASDLPAIQIARRQRVRTRLSVAMGVWALGYAIYRGYYAAGGTWLLPGTIRPGSAAQFQLINLAAAIILGVAAVLPVAVLPLWPRRWPRRVLLTLCWLVAVGCCMHAVIDMTERVLSLAGLLTIHYPALWASVDRRDADLQDLFGNEPWFLLEGLAFAALGWTALDPGRARRWWTASAVAAIAALIVIGLLSATGVIGQAVVA
jgi:hypothetical protein